MKYIQNGEAHISLVLAGLSLAFLIACIIYWIWRMKGVYIYLGIITIIVGIFIIYMAFNDINISKL